MILIRILLGRMLKLVVKKRSARMSDAVSMTKVKLVTRILVTLKYTNCCTPPGKTAEMVVSGVKILAVMSSNIIVSYMKSVLLQSDTVSGDG